MSVFVVLLSTVNSTQPNTGRYAGWPLPRLCEIFPRLFAAALLPCRVTRFKHTVYFNRTIYQQYIPNVSAKFFLYDLYEKNPSQKAKEGPQRSTKHWCIPKLEESRRQFSTARSPSPTFPWLGHLNFQPIFASFPLKWTVVTLSTIDVADYFSCLLHLLIIIIIISFSCWSVKLF